ncbi:MAG: hypothetical protein Q7K55_00685, partial [Candidatus Levybacteria bacterium]|nr:hypothetical protein [Candidatus Levybacteria bacterium]
NNGKVLKVGNLNDSKLYDPLAGTWTNVSGSSLYRYKHAVTILNNNKALATGSSSATDAGISVAELYDPSANTWSSAATMNYVRSLNTATVLSNGKVLIVGSGLSGSSGTSISELYSVDQMVNTGSDLADQSNPTSTMVDTNNIYYAWQGRRGSGQGGGGTSGDSDRGGGSWKIYGQKTDNPASGSLTAQWPSGTTGAFTTTGTMSYARYAHTATLLNNGKVLATGTVVSNDGQSIAELYNPVTKTWANTTGTMSYRRSRHTATLLNNGKVLLAGAAASSNAGQSITEVYDPSTNTISITGTMITWRNRHTATLLNNGKVLLAGGWADTSGITFASIAEIFDPSTNTISSTGTLSYGRGYPTATLLNNGKVLVAGTTASNAGISIAEFYDPAAGTFSIAGTMAGARSTQTATLLNNGKVLFIGHSGGGTASTTAEIFDPSTNTFSLSGASPYARYDHTATLLNNGKVMFTGTTGLNSGQSVAELYDPSASTFSATGTMAYARDYNTATVLNSGKVLITGSSIASPNDGGSTVAELYNPAGELALSHDFAIHGDQTMPQIVNDGTSPIAVWADTRPMVESTGTNISTDSNIFMQKFSASTGEPLWPSGATTGVYTSPYVVMDTRADTYWGSTGTQYSGRPRVGGIATNMADNSKKMVIGFEDSRYDSIAPASGCGNGNTNSLIQVCSQSYDVSEYNMNQSTNWAVIFHASSATTPNIKIYTDIMEWDGTTIASTSGGFVQWTACDPSCPSAQTATFLTGTSPINPPSDVVGNVSMRRLRVRFSRVSGSVTITYDGTNGDGQDSRLTTGTVVPEKTLILGLIIPFLPPVMYRMMRRRKRDP